MTNAENINLASLIDHTLLKADATAAQIVKFCAEARKYGFAAVCVHPSRLGLIVAELTGSPVKPCTVAGFALGATTTTVKAFEAAEAVHKGAQEIDMVMSVGKLKDGDYDFVREDIRAVVTAAEGRLVKVILEVCLLTDDEKKTACRLAMEAGAKFVKTSTGLSSGGATEADIRLMRAIVGPSFGVKAAGGIRTREDALNMVAAGANRIGTSSGITIVTAQ